MSGIVGSRMERRVWEREVGIGGGRGVFWNFFFLRKGVEGGGRGGMGVVGSNSGSRFGKWV